MVMMLVAWLSVGVGVCDDEGDGGVCMGFGVDDGVGMGVVVGVRVDDGVDDGVGVEFVGGDDDDHGSCEDLDGDLERAGFGATQEEKDDEAWTDGEGLRGDVAIMRDATDVLIDALYADVPLSPTNNPARSSRQELQG
jgi:hypothetical protein